LKQLSLTSTSNVVPLHANRLGKAGCDTLLEDWLKRSPSTHTRRVYRSAIAQFFSHIADTDPTELLAQFLSLDQTQAYELVSQYQGALVETRSAPATINRKLAAIKSLVSYAAECGKCHYTLTNIKSEKLKPYRDTRGISQAAFQRMLEAPDRSTLLGKRDYTILLLLWGNALRRSELAATNVGDFDPEAGTLRIYGKGRGNQAETVTLGQGALSAIQDWLAARGEAEPGQPLFIALHPSYYGHRLITNSIWKLVGKYAKKSGITKPMSPHRIRHSSITAALDATNGDVRAVQKLSRHSNLNTLMIYDDNRRGEQGRITQKLDSLVCGHLNREKLTEE
jgi:integrase/recombinase XerC